MHLRIIRRRPDGNNVGPENGQYLKPCHDGEQVENVHDVPGNFSDCDNERSAKPSAVKPVADELDESWKPASKRINPP